MVSTTEKTLAEEAPAKAPNAPVTKFDYIDAMRGIAILLVILVHSAFDLAIKGPAGRIGAMGQFGVQMFFVASALTLCLSWEARRDEPHPMKSFLIRRFFRIAPMYYFGIAFYL